MKKGFGFVEFYDHEDAKDAVDQMNGERTEVGSKIVVEMAGDRPNNKERPTRGPQKDDKCFNWCIQFKKKLLKYCLLRFKFTNKQQNSIFLKFKT